MLCSSKYSTVKPYIYTRAARTLVVFTRRQKYLQVTTQNVVIDGPGGPALPVGPLCFYERFWWQYGTRSFTGLANILMIQISIQKHIPFQ